MKEVIIIEKDNHLSALYELNLNLWLNCNIKRFNEAKFAIDYLKANKADLIVSRQKSGLEKSSLAIKSFLISQKIKTPLIVLGNENIINEKECTINFSDIKKLIQCAASFLKVTAKDMAKLEVPKYYPIGLRNFCIVKTLPCTVYKKVEDEAYETFFEDKVDINKLVPLHDSKEEFLYIQREHRLKFISLITEGYLIDLNKRKELQLLKESKKSSELQEST